MFDGSRAGHVSLFVCLLTLTFVVFQTNQEEKLKQKLLEEQFQLLQGTVAEAENIIQDAVAKLDDPLHIRCTSSPGQTPSTRQTTPDLCKSRLCLRVA